MPTVQAPLLSFQARGTFADMIVYSTWLGRSYVKRRPTQSLSNTDDQRSFRVMFGFLTDAWPYIFPDDKQTWQPLAEARKITPANAYAGYNLHRWAKYQKPSQTYPANASTTPVSITAFAAIAGKGYIDYNAQANAMPWLWAVAFGRHAPPTIWPLRHQIIAIRRTTPLGNINYHEDHVPPGQHYVYAKTYNVDGNAGPYPSPILLTVT